MRLKPDETKKLASYATDILFKDKNVEMKATRQQINDAIYYSLHHHFEEERMIDTKSDELFKTQSSGTEPMDKGKAMQMIKKQIAKETNFILSGGSEGRFSQDKIYHISHLVADKLYDDDLCDFVDEDEGAKWFKKLFGTYFELENELEEKVRKKIQSQGNAPFEGSREWDILFRKYKEEALNKINHGG